tara:strand:+ start:67 stop:663 length:597 start_codon:yes stop_codon:yes gene_type:complete
MKLQIGNDINITYKIDDQIINDKATISFIDKDLIYTCGHCFPPNAETNVGKVIYSSGFDTFSESEEIAIIKIFPKYLKNINNIKLSNQYKFKIQETILLNNGNFYKGKILAKIDKKISKGWINIADGILINHQINKINVPYYIVKIKSDLNFPGLSGSPWIVKQNNVLTLVGSHIGRTEAIIDNSRKIMVAYVKPFSI